MIHRKNFRLNGWFQTINDDQWDDDKLEAAIRERLKTLGLTFQGGPVVHEVDLPAGG